MDIIKPGLFGKAYSADSRRSVFDFHNEQILTENKKVDYVFIGDSITEYWDLNVYFNNAGYIVNRGIGGDVSEIILKRFDADVLQLNPCKAICLVGCNDLMGMHDDYWWKIKGKVVEEITNELINNIEKIIEKCKGVDLYICSILPSALCVPFDSEKFNEAIVKVNREIVKLCEKHSVAYIDYHSTMCKEDGKTVMDNITYDGVHPTPVGYKLMAEVLRKSIPELK